MAAFTSITTGTKYLSRDIVNEVVLAYSERRQCVGDSAVAGVPVGFNLQTLSFWWGMQDWIETNCVKWVDDADLSTVTEYDAPGDIAYTLATFRTEAGLNASGFRRATEWPGTFSYGKIQSGDIIGPWIIEDLHKAFDALRWTYGPYLYGNITKTTENGLFKAALEFGSDRQDTYDSMIANLMAWASATTDKGYWYTMEFDPNGTLLVMQVYVADVVYGDIPTHLSHSAESYLWPPLSFIQDGSPHTFFDGHSLGTEAKKLYPMQSFSSASTDERTVTAIDIGDGAPPINFDLDYYGNSPHDLIVLKWSFTNTL